MKLSSGAAEGFIKRPDTSLLGALIHGPDPALLAMKRREIIAKLAEGDDLRLTQVDPSVVGKSPAELDTALKSRGFFPGRRVVLLDGARDATTKTIEGVLEDVTVDDAFLVVIATNLNARSSLRKLFEGRKELASLAFYHSTLNPDEVAEKLRRTGCRVELTPDALGELTIRLADMDPGSGAQLVDKISLFLINETESVDLDHLAGQLPLTNDTDIEALVDCVVDGRPSAVGPLMRRLQTGGVNAVQIMIFTSRRFRDILTVIASPDGIDAGLNQLRPPAFGPRRQRLGSQARNWSARIEAANKLVFATEQQLRSSGTRPDMALVERCLLRLAMMAAQRR